MTLSAISFLAAPTAGAPVATGTPAGQPSAFGCALNDVLSTTFGVAVPARATAPMVGGKGSAFPSNPIGPLVATLPSAETVPTACASQQAPLTGLDSSVKPIAVDGAQAYPAITASGKGVKPLIDEASASPLEADASVTDAPILAPVELPIAAEVPSGQPTLPAPASETSNDPVLPEAAETAVELLALTDGSVDPPAAPQTSVQPTPPAATAAPTTQAAPAPSIEAGETQDDFEAKSVPTHQIEPEVRTSRQAAAPVGFAERLTMPQEAALPSVVAEALPPHIAPTSAGSSTETPASPAVAFEKPVPVVAAQPGAFGREMGVTIARHITAGKEELTIRLDPVELGRIEVRMSFDDRGSLRAVVAAEHPAALEMLRRETGDLNRALTDAGVRADAQSFRFDARTGGGDSGSGWQRPHDEERRDSSNQHYPHAAQEDEQQHRSIRSSGAIDLMA